MKEPQYAVVVCTRNRPEDLTVTLLSICDQETIEQAEILIVDASDPPVQRRINSIVGDLRDRCRCRLVAFAGEPSLARQRNTALDRLGDSICHVHFLDDDVVLEPGYLVRLNEIMAERTDVAGVAGRLVEQGGSPPGGRLSRVILRLFLLDSKRPGALLSSGATTAGQKSRMAAATEVDWLGGCASYPRRTFGRLRFDDRLRGYSLDEDLDYSHRAGRLGPLLVDPSAVVHHRVSPHERPDSESQAFQAIVHRFWFLEKNSPSRFWKAAWGWSMLGRLVIPLLSRHPDRSRVFRGRVRGLGSVLRRRHYLLRTAGDPAA